MGTHRQRVGALAEQRAVDLIAAAGYDIVLRNYRCRMGELDIVARRAHELVIAEVRLRSSARFGGAAASIHAAKRRRLVLATRHLLACHPALAPLHVRFDALLLGGADAPIQWLQNVL